MPGNVIYLQDIDVDLLHGFRCFYRIIILSRALLTRLACNLWARGVWSGLHVFSLGFCISVFIMADTVSYPCLEKWHGVFTSVSWVFFPTSYFLSSSFVSDDDGDVSRLVCDSAVDSGIFPLMKGGKKSTTQDCVHSFPLYLETTISLLTWKAISRVTVSVTRTNWWDSETNIFFSG